MAHYKSPSNIQAMNKQIFSNMDEMIHIIGNIFYVKTLKQ